MHYKIKTMERYLFDEIMKLPCENNVGLLISLNILNKYVKVNLINSENNSLFYEVSINELLLSNISSDELIQVRNANWEKKENNKLIRKI